MCSSSVSQDCWQAVIQFGSLLVSQRYLSAPCFGLNHAHCWYVCVEVEAVALFFAWLGL